MKKLVPLSILVSLQFFATAQNLIHNFEFNGNLNDTKPTGVVLSPFNVASSSFSTGPNAWTWSQPTSPGGGLVLEIPTSLLTNPQSYSVGFRISFQETGNPDGSTKSFKKILTFKGQTNDNGLYFNHQNLQFFPFGADNSVTYLPNTFYDFVLTRDANTNTIKVFIVQANGTVTKVYDVADTNGDAVPFQPTAGGPYELRFFMNDNTATENTSGGTVRSIRVWDSPLSPDEIAAALSSVTTGQASNISAGSAVLNGEVNPQGNTATFTFEYGTTTSYGQTVTGSPSTNSGSVAVAITANITGLQSNTTYHFRLGSTVGGSTVFGSDQTFTTNAPPGGVAGANLWLKANTGTSPASGTLTGWTDQTGTNSFTVSGNPQTGASKINFNNAVDFDGTGDYLTGNTAITFQTLYAVIKRNNTNFTSTVMSPANGSLNRGYILKGDELGTGNNDGASYFKSSGTLGATNARLATVEIVNGQPPTGHKTFIDGTFHSTVSLLGTGNFTLFSAPPYIGRSEDNNGPDFFDGQIAELIMYPASHNDADRNKIQSYLAIKYGISLDASVTNYVSSAGTPIWNNTTYWHDVFGIGKDDGSGLNQTQSNSINTGSGDGTGQNAKGNIVLNSLSGLNNNQFVLLGHDNGSLSETTSELTTLFPGNKRLERKWKIKNTGNVSQVGMDFDFSGLTISGTDKSQIRLIVDVDGDGNFNTGTPVLYVADGFSNNKAQFVNVNLPDNAVFGFTTFSPAAGGVQGGKLWLKANDGATNIVSSLVNWTDQTGNNIFSKAGSIGYVTNAINFNPSVSFNNTDANTAVPSNRLDGNTSIQIVEAFAVYKKQNGTAGGTVTGSVQNGSAYGVAIFGGENPNDAWVANGVSSAFSHFTNASLATQFGMVNFDVAISTPIKALGFYNGTQQTITDGSGANFSNISFIPRIGGTNNAGSLPNNGWKHFQGEIAEIIMYPFSLASGIERLKVSSYLALKYGISFGDNTNAFNYYSSGENIIWPGNATYKYDIFGIGKDDGSGLNQPASNSINTGSGDGTGQSGKGNIVLSNASSLEDADFLIIGHDNAALTEQSFDLPTVLANAKRLEREWKVSRTNDVGTVTLKFSTLGLTISGTSLADFKLLVDTDGNGDFNNGIVTEVIASSFVNNEVKFTGVTLPNDAVFTLMTQKPQVGPGVLGATLWLKANEGVASAGSTLNAWVDQTFTNTFTKTGTIGFTANAINFNPIVSFNNTDAKSALPSSRLDGNNEISYVDGFAVYRFTSSNRGTLIGGIGTNANYGKAIFGADGDLKVYTGNGLNKTYQSYANSNLENLFTINNLDISLASSPYATGRLNGADQTITAGAGATPDFSSISVTPMIGGTDNSGPDASVGWPHFYGEVAEMVLYPTSLTSAEKLKVESYLAIKYGISLDPSVGSYVNSFGTVIWNNTTYWHDVFGIGRDTRSGLNQLSSNSINTGSGDGTGQSGKGNIVLSSPTPLNSGKVLMLGHDNASLSSQLTELPSAVTGLFRLAREWKVKNTEGVGAVDITFSRTGLGFTGTAVADFKLLIDTDGDGDFTTGSVSVVNSNSISGDLINFTGVTLSNDVVFTFITGPAPGPGVAGASLWLKANAGATNSGSNLTGWTDQSGLNTFSVVGAPGYKPNAINFNEAVTFNNTDPLTSLPSNRLDGNNNITYVDGFAVYKHTDNNSTFLGATSPGGAYGKAIFASAGANTSWVGNGNFLTNSSFTAAGLTNSFGLANMDVSLTTTPFATGRYNGAIQSVTAGAGGDFANLTFTPMIGGTNNSGSDPATGWNPAKAEVAEIVLFPSSLSASDKLKVESYLAVKYGITLSPTVTNYVNSSGSVIWNNTTYWHDVFGIGKDDGSGLNQPQSNSINSGSGDGTGQSGKGNIVLSNASSLNNNDFLIIGHDNGALAEQVTDIPASLNLGSKRLQREWKAKHTGNVGTVTIKFDMNGVTQTGVTAANFKLMIDTDGNGDFTNGTVTLADAASYTGGIVTFNGVSIPDGAVFTLKTGFAPSPGVPGSTLWVKSNAGTSPASGTLTSWTDQDGINTFTVSGNPQTGVNKINYNNVIDFDGAGDYITGNSAIVFQTLYAVLKQNTTSGTSTVMSASNGNQNLGFMMKGNNMATGDNQSGANNDAFQSTGSLGTAPSIGVVEIKTNALPEACQSYINGKNYATTRFAGTNGTLSPFASIPFIGRSQSNSAFDYFNGQLAELIMYPASHTNDQRRTIESYLAVKYGISLDPSFGNWTSSDGTIIWNVTNNNLYNNDVFGIGRDIATGLNQPASNSMNSGSGDGVGQTAKANIVIKAPSSLDDKDYLMIGHNGIAAVEAQPADPEYDDLPSRLMGKGVTRLRREWKVQRTGDVGSITLEIDLNGINTTGDLPGSTSNPAGNLSDFGIVIDLDGDGDFTTGTVLTRNPNSFGSPKLIFNTQDLPNNAVFTIATNGGGTILPVTMTRFEGSAAGCMATLQWQAATESNMKQYDVQWSSSAQNDWTSLTSLKAKNSNNSRYAFSTGMTQGKTQFFRLKMTDNDGTVSYSKVLSLQCAANNTYTIYPNPASSRISITGTKAGQQLQVMGLDGKVIQMHLANEGNTSIGINALPAGTYLIRIGTKGQWIDAGRFIRQ